MNRRDSEFITGLFLKQGYELADSPESAGVVLFNTCSVREHAEHRAVSNMGQLISKKRDKIYGLVGCMAQALGEELFKRLGGLDIVCGTGEIARLPELVEKAMRDKILALGNIDGHLPERDTGYREDKKHAYVSIMRGCNNFCGYCIVPYVRGRERSRDAEVIVSEIEGLVEKNIRDITLLGQNVNSYCSSAHDFVKLLRTINNIEGLEKIKFMTSHPKDAGVKLFKAVKELDKVVKHLHLPLQSGSDRILSLMNRGYARGAYLKLVSEARKTVPGLRLTTDIIVGFPTETDSDFQDTMKVMKEVRFDLAYIFKYSPRPGTQAAKMKDEIPLRMKKERHRILLDMQRKL